MATHSNILAWNIPWTQESGRPQSVGSQRLRPLRMHAHTHVHDDETNYVFWNMYFIFSFCLAYIHILRVLERSKNLVKGELTDFPQILLDSYAVDSLQMISGIFMEGLMRNP